MRILSLTFLLASIGQAYATVPWDDVDKLFSLGIEESSVWGYPSAEEMKKAGCPPERVAKADNYHPYNYPRKVLIDLARTQEMRDGLLSAKEPQHLYLLARILSLNVLRTEAQERKLKVNDLLKQAADGGSLDAKAYLIHAQMHGTKMEEVPWAENWRGLSALAEKNKGRAYYTLANFYATPGAYAKYSDAFVPAAEKKKRFTEWVCKSASLGFRKAYLSCAHEQKKIDPKEAEKWFLKAAETGAGIDNPKSCVVADVDTVCPFCKALSKKGESETTYVPPKLAGVYVSKPGDDAQFLVLSADKKPMFYGVEDFGEHGQAYFAAPLEDLRIDAGIGHIEFRIGERNFYPEPITPEKPTPQSKSNGATSEELFFKGLFSSKGVKMTCKGSCASKVEFVKQP